VFVREIGPSSGTWTLDTPLAGGDAGLLVLHTSCAAADAPASQLRVSWTSEIPSGVITFQAGPRLVVPLDASPRWLLARQISALHIRASDRSACPASAVVRAELWQRQSAAITDPK
jgi:hypothetical protein